MNAGTDRETNDSLGRSNERVRQQTLDTDAKLSGDKLGFLERRTDEYPDFSAYSNLMMGLGRMGGGGTGAPPLSAPGGYPTSGAGGTNMMRTPLGTKRTYGLEGTMGGVPESTEEPRQQVFTRQPNGGISQVSRTRREMELARNPFALGG
jgi:hypothetical protein